MVKAKPKTNGEEKPKKRTGFSEEREQIAAHGDSNTVKWKDEVKELSSRSFASLDDALSALVEMALSRVGVNDEATREFLFTTMKNDPEIMEELGCLLKVKS